MKKIIALILAALIISLSACIRNDVPEQETVENGTGKGSITASEAINIVCDELNIEYDGVNVTASCRERDGGWELTVYHCDGEHDLVTTATVDSHGNVLELSTATIIENETDPDEPIVARKPVIYLYPTEETEVGVTLDFDGELTCSYPEYTDGWAVTAYPDGTLTDENGRRYYCLFWEGENYTEYDFSQGFCVKGEETAAFLEYTLAKLGLNEREANEFIIYWLPQMQDNEYNLISFQAEAYTSSAELVITPAPDSLLRVFMAWMPLDEAVEIEPQEFSKFERIGFVAVEWGGAMMK